MFSIQNFGIEFYLCVVIFKLTDNYNKKHRNLQEILGGPLLILTIRMYIVCHNWNHIIQIYSMGQNFSCFITL